MKKYDVGKRAPVFVKHWWDERGYFAWDVYMIGDCERYIEESSAGSYEKVQECTDDDMYGKITGFSCRRRSFERMARACPWLARLAEDLRWFDMADGYSCAVSDQPTVYTSIVRAGVRKTIRDYAPGTSGPPRLALFEETIASYADFVDWSD